MLQNELQRERERLKNQIAEVEADLQPKQAELRELREKLTHIEALLPIEKGGTGSRVKAPPRIWAKLCREHSLQIGGDSAHRVVRRENPVLHQSIPHWCTYDNRQYP